MKNGKLENVKSLVPRFITSLSGKKKYYEEMVIYYWDKIVGEDIARHTVPVSFSFNTLFIFVDSPSWSTELYFLRYELIEKINSFVEYRLVKEIRFTSRGEKKNKKNEIYKEEEIILSEITEKDKKRAEELSSEAKDEDIKKAVKNVIEKEISLYRSRVKMGWHKCEICGHLTEKESKYCYLCEQKIRNEKSEKIRKVILACPWFTYAEIDRNVPCTSRQANIERVKLIQGFLRKVVYGDFESFDAKILVMLIECIRPEELTKERMEKTMNRFRYSLLQPPEIKVKSFKQREFKVRK